MSSKSGKQLRPNSYVIACLLMGIVGALLLMGWASAAAPGPGVEVGPDQAQEAHAGDTVLYDHVLTNTGATTDTFQLEVVSARDWPVELVGADQPTGTLTLQVAAQMTVPFQISLAVPSDAVGLTDTTVVTATSQLSPTIQDSATDATSVVYYRYYFPFLAKRWPPIPYPPTLHPIDNADEDGFYTVDWDAGPPPTDSPENYTLEEDDNANFSSPTVVYSGPNTYWSGPETARPGGTYYYRVRAQNQWGYGMYSNVQTTTVVPFRVADTELAAGQCTTLSWNFTGIKALHVVLGYGYEETPVPGQDARQVCPSVTTTYRAVATKQDDSKEIYQTTVYVTGTGCGDPIIWYFASNSYHIHAGETILVSWHVECAKAVWLVYGGSEQAVVGHDYRAVRIVENKKFRLKVKKADDSFVYASFTVYVQ